MRKFGYIALFLVSALLTHIIIIHRAPAAIMKLAFLSLGGGEQFNTMIPSDPITPSARRVVLPSPDLVYSACIYDVTNGPVMITMHPSSDYHSLSIYDRKTNNFFVKNDQEIKGNVLRVLLVQHEGDGLYEADYQVKAPTEHGIAIIRRLAATPDLLTDALESRKADSCEAMKSDL